jgi:hypothetical protein
MCECTVFLIDRTAQDQVGHHLQYNSFFSKALRENSQNFFLINHTADISMGYQVDSGNFNLWAKKQDILRQMEISTVIRIVEMNSITNFHVFFTWTRHFLTKDLQKWNEELFGYNFSLEGLGPASNWVRKLPGWEKEFRHAYSFVSSSRKTRYLSWDRKLEDLGDSRFRQIPDFAAEVQNFSRRPLEERVIIGFFGPGTHDRGFSTFLLMALLNPSVQFRFYGRTVNWNRLIYINLRFRRFSFVLSRALSVLMAPCFFTISKLPNLQIAITYPEMSILISKMQSCDAIFYESKNRGESSGLVMHSLAAKVPVLYMGKDSQIIDWLDEHAPCGRIKFRDNFQSGRLKKRVIQLSTKDIPDTPSWEDFKGVFLSFRCQNTFE